MTDRELMQQALDVIEAAIKAGDWKVDGACDPDYVLEALRARLAQPEPEELGEIIPADEEQLKRIAKLVEPEPVAWTVRGLITDFSRDFSAYQTKTYTVPLYTSPHSATHSADSADSAESFCKPKPVGYGIRQITNDEGVEEWEDIRTSPDVAHEEAVGMMETGRGEQYEVVPLYTAPPQREWQGMTENEIKHLWYEACQTNLELTSQLIVHLARNIEAKLKEKNIG